MESWITEYWIWLVVAAAVIATVLLVMVIMSGAMRFLRAAQASTTAEAPRLAGIEHDLAAAATAVESAVLDLAGIRCGATPRPRA